MLVLVEVGVVDLELVGVVVVLVVVRVDVAVVVVSVVEAVVVVVAVVVWLVVGVMPKAHPVLAPPRPCRNRLITLLSASAVDSHDTLLRAP